MKLKWLAVVASAALAACGGGKNGGGVSGVEDAASGIDAGNVFDASGTDGAMQNGLQDGGGVNSNGVTIIVEPNGNKAKELVNAIAAAKTSVYMTMYEGDNSSILGAIVARKQAGLEVKVIFDGSTTTKSFNMPAFTQLQTAGIGVVWSNPTFTYTHEKCIIIDGVTAWIMTMNINNSSPNYNREYLAIDTIAADVAEATSIFKADYAMTSISPTGDLVVANNNARVKLFVLLGTATQTIDLEVEEFSDQNQNGIVQGLVAAAGRGVRVRVVIGNETLSTGQIAANNAVKTAGGTVVMTGPSSENGTATNPYIHAKAITIDCTGTTCTRGWVGSENMSAGSLSYNRELGVIISDAIELAKIETAIETDFGRGVAQ